MTNFECNVMEQEITLLKTQLAEANAEITRLTRSRDSARAELDAVRAESQRNAEEDRHAWAHEKLAKAALAEATARVDSLRESASQNLLAFERAQARLTEMWQRARAGLGRAVTSLQTALPYLDSMISATAAQMEIDRRMVRAILADPDCVAAGEYVKMLEREHEAVGRYSEIARYGEREARMLRLQDVEDAHVAVDARKANPR
jgi:chromosome segregation ATPase